jgi:phosphate transport system permease protein
VALTTIAVGGRSAADQVRRDLSSGTRDLGGTIFKTVLQLCLIIALLVLVFLLADVWSDGRSILTGDLQAFLTQPFGARAASSGIYQALRGTFWIGLVTAATFPLGVAAAIYLEEYAPRTRLTNFININIRNLSGVPSVVYGILALTYLVGTLKGITGGRSLISGAIAVAILVLPIVIITSAEAIRAVPQSLREGAFGLGATRWEVIRTQVLPFAAPGILTGTVLALARALGEAAPLILVGAIDGRLVDNTGFFDPSQLTDSFTALPIAITSWAGRPLDSGFFEMAAAAIVVMLVIVLLANSAAIILRNRFEKKRG